MITIIYKYELGIKSHHDFCTKIIDVNYKSWKFPDGAINCRLENEHLYKAEDANNESFEINARINSNDDIMLLLLLTDALRRINLIDIELNMAYIPYSRQDRGMVPGESLALKVFCGLINAQNYRKVYVFDPHSDVAPALLNNVVITNNHKFVFSCMMKIIDKEEPVYLVVPDAGALKKSHQLVNYLNKRYQNRVGVVVFEKYRDLASGEILEIREIIRSHPVPVEKLPEKINYFVVDDICDGGRTFIELSKKMDKVDMANKHLIISHGIFSNQDGLNQLLNSYGNIYTTNSFPSTFTDERIKTYKVIDTNRK